MPATKLIPGFKSPKSIVTSVDEETAKSKVLPKSKKYIPKILFNAGYNILNKKLSSLTDSRR